MKIAVLGAGNGGCAAAADWALAGFRVSLLDFEDFPENIQAINKQGGIVAEGAIEGFAPIEYAGHSIEKALDDAGVIMLVTISMAVSGVSASLETGAVRPSTFMVGGTPAVRNRSEARFSCIIFNSKDNSIAVLRNQPLSGSCPC